MSRTFKEQRLKFVRDNRTGGSPYPLSTKEKEDEVKFKEIARHTTDGFRDERRHSAAHRHSAIKTRKRCNRINKHLQKRNNLIFENL